MRKDGTYVPVLKNASQLHDSKGGVIGAVETITDISEIVEKDKQIAAIRRQLRSEDAFQGLIGASAPMQQVFYLIENAAQSDAPVIILGESGTGKELAARAIHQLGERKKSAYVKVNCAALTESLLESELFGHVKGAYTGAYKSRAGRFEMAQGGDIFLDEIGDLPLSTQVKLLRVLEEKVIERVGDSKSIPVDVRVISATNKNLSSLVENGGLQKRPLLSDQRDPDPDAAAAGAGRGYSASGRILLSEITHQERQKHRRDKQSGAGGPHEVPLARQCPGAQKRLRICLCDLPGALNSAPSSAA